MDPRFVVNRQGTNFVLYGGLLNEAHERGLSLIETDIVQLPTESNGNTAVVKARVTTPLGTFSGIGDANPSNVSRMILPHLIRMAETRAKARALRDAVNIAMCSLEELGDEEPPAPKQSAPARPTSMQSWQQAGNDNRRGEPR